jgi:hypothetical protein
MNFHAYVAEIVSESRQGTIFSKRKYDDILAAIQDKDGNFKCAEVCPTLHTQSISSATLTLSFG